MKLTKDEVRRIAHLARLGLNEEEVTLYQEQLSKILTYLDQLHEVRTDGVQPTAQMTGLTNRTREDAVSVYKEADALVAQSPLYGDGGVRVKKVL